MKRIVGALLLAAACSDDPGASEAEATETLVDGTPLAVGTLLFVNDPGTTLAVLDDDVSLHSGAAANLIAHRDGPDGIPGNKNDNRFDDTFEVLSVSQVGPARLQQIAKYAAQKGWVPTGDEVLGVYDDVSFTVNEAAQTVSFVNAVSETVLDDEVALDRRAVDSILAKRPLVTVLALSKLHFVSTSALIKLKAHALPDPPGQEGDDCTAHADCQAPLRCTGYPNDGPPLVGKCAPTATDFPGEDLTCTESSSCQGDLVCMGTTVYDGSGFCRPQWMAGTFENREARAIPDGDPNGTSATVVSYGLATAPDDIVVTLDIDHPRPQDSVVTLSSSNGSSAVLWNHEGSPEYELPAVCCIERDQYVNRTWTLSVVDTVSGQAGQLNGFKVYISSRWD